MLLPLYVVQPSSSQLAKLCLQWSKMEKQWGWQEMGNGGAALASPRHGGQVPQSTLPLPRWRRRLVGGVGLGSILDSAVPGEGWVCADYSVLYVCSAALQYCINARKGG